MFIDFDKLNKTKMLDGKTVEDNIIALIAKIGEKITIGKAYTVENKNSQNSIYQHSVIKDNVSKLSYSIIRNNTKWHNKYIWKAIINACCCRQSFGFKFKWN